MSLGSEVVIPMPSTVGAVSKMIKTLRMAAFSVMVFASTANPTAAEQLTAGGLYEFCNSTDVAVKNACRYFILGVVEGADTTDGTVMRGKQFVPGRKTIICMPVGGVPDSQMVAAFQNAMRLISQAYPDDLKEPAVSAVISTMAMKYPCR
jgi:hypothetical protein